MALNVISSDRLSTNVKASNLATSLSGKVGSSKNLIINGAMNVAQRATQKTTHTGAGFFTVDRIYTSIGGEDEGRTEDQISLTSSDTGPWAKGFTKAFQITNGNQSSAVGTGDYQNIVIKNEAQNIANSGWDYTSASSYITFSFWVKSSVAQNFYGFLKTQDGTQQYYSFETGSLSANTWTKITKTIPGNSNITIDNNNGEGLTIEILPFLGTSQTGTRTLNTWSAWDANTRTPNNTTTWWETDNATFAITGLQLEVGETATEFEHIPYVDDLIRCQRYCYMIFSNSAGEPLGLLGYLPNTSVVYYSHVFPVPMKSGPTFSKESSFSVKHISYDDSGSSDTGLTQEVYNANPRDNSVTAVTLKFTVTGLGSAGTCGQLQGQNAGWLKWEAEL